MVKFPNKIADIPMMLASLPAANKKYAERARKHEAQLTKPTGSLGRLEMLSEWMSCWSRSYPPTLAKPEIIVFAGNHGVARHNVSAFPSEVTGQMLANFHNRGAAINQLAKQAGASLRVIDVGVSEPTHDFTRQAAMSDSDFLRAFQVGFASVSDECDLLALGEMGIANTSSASALSCALYGGSTREWVGAGTGINDATLHNKISVVGDAVSKHVKETRDPLALFARLGGKELAAIAGASLAARCKSIPLLLDGFVCCAAIAPLAQAKAGFVDHMQAAHLSSEKPHAKLLQLLSLKPVIDLNMRLGEASGAAIAIMLVRAALACHNGMATFAEAEVATKLK